jgi:hypothetical protein
VSGGSSASIELTERLVERARDIKGIRDVCLTLEQALADTPALPQREDLSLAAIPMALQPLELAVIERPIAMHGQIASGT